MADIDRTLNTLKPGQTAIIVGVDGHDGIACRLREMGFLPGQTVTFLRSAPLGDPLKCFIRGSRVAVRVGEACRVRVGSVGEAAVTDRADG